MQAEIGATPAQAALNDLASQILQAADDAKAGRKRAREELAASPTARQWYAEHLDRVRGGEAPEGGAISQRCALAAPVDNRNVNRAWSRDGKPTMNIKAVVDVLIDEGMDPTTELVRVLKGEPDPEDPTKRIFALTPPDRAKLLATLMEYVHPKRKAIEFEDKTPVRGAELDAKLSMLLGRYMALNGSGLPEEMVRTGVRNVLLEMIDEAEAEEAAAEFDPNDMV